MDVENWAGPTGDTARTGPICAEGEQVSRRWEPDGISQSVSRFLLTEYAAPFRHMRTNRSSEKGDRNVYRKNEVAVALGLPNWKSRP